MSILSRSADQISTAALRDIGVVGRAGQTAPARFLVEAYDAMNEMLDSWRLAGLMAVCARADIYDLATSAVSYTIGPTGATIMAERPEEIMNANLIINNSNPVFRAPLAIIDRKRWAEVKIRDIYTEISSKLYYDNGFDSASGFGTINLNGLPQAGYQLELFTPQQLTSFADQTTQYLLPSGYANAIRKCLAVAVAPMMALHFKGNDSIKPMQFFPIVQQQALVAVGLIQSRQKEDEELTPDIAFSGSGSRGFNWRTGDK